eukprot:CAMPEP_0168747156 /NCGR_PEP_ID=MMETSP0724-20121128/15517_1 /TAXON_ID=265536 /ORGANISM="Amphiprora sp., Strain CCMP467" /LENGTH=285 /DNA_ID=CAMNT_0008794949 /DNA_START=33 /DNA_END=893 /DNA_ORIENTATION=+
MAVKSLGALVLEFLRLADVQRLCQTSKPFQHVSKQHAAIVKWLRDLEVLYCLGCPDELRQRISLSIREHGTDYRVMSYEEGGFMTRFDEDSIFGAIDTRWYDWILDLYSPQCRFATMEGFQLEEYCGLENGEAYETLDSESESDEEEEDQDDEDDVEQPVSDDDGPSSPAMKKLRYSMCSSQFCSSQRLDTSVSRLFNIEDKQYCGHCLDESTFLKLMFCSRHMSGHNGTDWKVVEPKYQKEGNEPAPEEWNLQENEFWVRLYFHQPYNYGELRFIGIGPRGRSD